jgi:Protein of unknown function (DUF4058)
MRPPFPGMDPWLEHANLWLDLHNSLITAIRDAIVPKVAPNYYVGIEQRTYESRPGAAIYLGRPDVGITWTGRTESQGGSGEAKSSNGPGVLELDVEVPVTEHVDEWYLQVREAKRGKLVTVIEVLSPTNKLRQPGRKQYLRKRDKIFDSRTSLVEIDLLRAGKVMPISIPSVVKGDYRILVSRGKSRPRARLYVFGLRQPIPDIPIPLLPRDAEPTLDLNTVLHDLYDRARFDLRLDYAQPAPPPALSEEDVAWSREIVSSMTK